VSAKLPAVNGKQVIAALEKEGWYVKRVRGSHHVLRHPNIPDASNPDFAYFRYWVDRVRLEIGIQAGQAPELRSLRHAPRGEFGA
jgi:hypothetical protein